jgi:hypothetical protein
MFCVELGGSYSPRRHWCFKQPDFGSKGPGPAYRLLMTFGNADDLAYEFATYCIATPGRPTQHSLEVCIETLIRSLRVGYIGRRNVACPGTSHSLTCVNTFNALRS